MFRRFIQKFRYVFKQIKNKAADLLNMVVDQPNTDEIKRYLDDEDRRHYKNRNGTDVYSVTTVIDQLEEENEGLKWWKKHNDGKGDNADWKHLLEYKKHRGTLAHHAALSSYNQKVHGTELWSDDESRSLHTLYGLDSDQDFLYSIVSDKGWVSDQEGFEVLQDGADIGLSDILHQDLDFFLNEFQNIMDHKYVSAENIEAVEEMFVVPPNHEHDGYGGQADLVYRDPATGEAVVADLKTSSAVRDKHKYQAAAYAKAVEKTDNLDVGNVARAEIIRIHPDSEESEVYEFNDFDQYWDEFAETTKEM